MNRVNKTVTKTGSRRARSASASAKPSRQRKVPVTFRRAVEWFAFVKVQSLPVVSADRVAGQTNAGPLAPVRYHRDE